MGHYIPSHKGGQGTRGLSPELLSSHESLYENYKDDILETIQGQYQPCLHRRAKYQNFSITSATTTVKRTLVELIHKMTDLTPQ